MHVWVVTGGDPPNLARLGELARPQLVVAADSGADIAGELGLTPDVIVGDFDSVSEAGSASAHQLRRFPTDKDDTDLTLALAEARDRGADSLTLIGGSGGRLDHFLANVAALASDDLAEVRVDALMGSSRIWVVRRQQTLSGEVGEIVTLLAYGGATTGIYTTGLRWELTGETLEAGSSRGVSNVMVAPAASVTVATGVVLAIRP